MTNSKKILWENVSALMNKRYGGENLTRCAKDSGVGPGTMSRIKEQRTSIGLEKLEDLAAFFKIEPYELLMPNMRLERKECEDELHNDLNTLEPHESAKWRLRIKAAADERRIDIEAARKAGRKQEGRESHHDPSLDRRRTSR